MVRPIRDPVLYRLLARMGYGPTAEEVALAEQLGYERYLEAQLYSTEGDDESMEAEVQKRYPLLMASSRELDALVQFEVYRQLTEATLYRAVFSRRQLFQKLVEFWSSHFSIWFFKVAFNLLIHDRSVTRRLALSDFASMLTAVAHSPAMLGYLDNANNRVGRPNENFARELLELHTLGLPGVFAQSDVMALSRIFTGWTVNDSYEFFFDAAIHDNSRKLLLGQSIGGRQAGPNATGEQEGRDALAILASHEATAYFVSQKLCRWFLGEGTATSTIRSVARVFRTSKGEMSAILRQVLQREHLAAASPKYKNGFHFVASILRSRGKAADGISFAASEGLQRVQHELFRWEPPNGFPDETAHWCGALLGRWSVATELIERTADLYAVRDHRQQVEAIDQALFVGTMPAQLRRLLHEQKRQAGSSATDMMDLLALTYATPAFMWF